MIRIIHQECPIVRRVRILEPKDATDAPVTGEEEVANEEAVMVLPKHRLKRMKRMKCRS